MSLRGPDGLTPREKLTQSAEQEKMVMETLLLKEALATSSENCELLLKEFIALQQTAEQKRQQESVQRLNELQQLRERHQNELQQLKEQQLKQLEELNESVTRLKNVNQKLESVISDQVSNLVDSVRTEMVAEVKKALNANKEEITKATADFHTTVTTGGEKMIKTMGEIQWKLSDKLRELETKQRRFFAFSGVKHFVFWAQSVLLLIEIVLLVWLLDKVR